MPSLEENQDSVKETRSLPNSAQTALEDDDTKYVIDKLLGHNKTPEETFYQVRQYGYDPADNTMEEETYIPVHFKARYSRSKTGTRSDSSKRRGRPIPNQGKGGNTENVEYQKTQNDKYN